MVTKEKSAIQVVQDEVKSTYKQIKKDKLIKKDLSIKFTFKGGKQGGYISSLKGLNNVLTPYMITIDFLGSYEPAYILLHEVAHQICIENDNNSKHDSVFKKTLNMLIKRYGY